MGVFGDPVMVCRSDNGKPGQFRCQPACDCKSPDAFQKNGGKELIHVEAKLARVVVLWDSCEIDKMKNNGRNPAAWYAAVVPVVPMQQLAPDQQRSIMNGERLAFYPLPGEVGGPIAQDSYLDLRLVVPVKQSLLLPNRVGALSEEAREGMYSHLFTFLTRRKLLEQVTCPGCGKLIDLEDVFARAV